MIQRTSIDRTCRNVCKFQHVAEKGPCQKIFLIAICAKSLVGSPRLPTSSDSRHGSDAVPISVGK